jgi:hypothetical protein
LSTKAWKGRFHLTENANSSEITQEDLQDSNLTYKAELIQWWRDTALSMYAAGKTMSAIADTLKVDISTISGDLLYLRKQVRDTQADYLEKEIPFRHKLRAANIDKAISEYWKLYETESDGRAKKALLDSITDALLKQAAIDGDPLSIERALKAVARLKRQMSTQEQEVTPRA